MLSEVLHNHSSPLICKYSVFMKLQLLNLHILKSWWDGSIFQIYKNIMFFKYLKKISEVFRIYCRIDVQNFDPLVTSLALILSIFKLQKCLKSANANIWTESQLNRKYSNLPEVHEVFVSEIEKKSERNE